MPNKRTAKTEREIKQAFLSLLEQKPIEKIRVSEIVSTAEISRATFYLHFDDIYSLYGSIRDEMLIELGEILIGSSKECIETKIGLSVNYLEQNKKLLELMINNGEMLKPLHDGALNILLNEFYPDGITAYGIVEVNFVVWGLLGSYNDWVAGKLDVTKEELVAFVNNIIGRFVVR